MRGYTDIDDIDTNYERKIAFLEVVHEIEEDTIIPKIFRQFEKDYNQRPDKFWLQKRYGLSAYWTNKLFRICQKRKRIGLSSI